MALLQRKIKGLAGEYPGELGIGVSAFEKHCRYALFSRVERNRTKKGEVCHVHGFDGSAHVTLAGGDVEEVLKKGWGGELLLESSYDNCYLGSWLKMGQNGIL